MKQLTFMLVALVAMMGMVSCDNKDPEQIAQFQQEFYVRSVDKNDHSVQFSQTVSVITANYTQSEMDITVTAKLNGSASATIQFLKLAMAYDPTTGMYSMSKGANTTVSGGAAVSDIEGSFDMNTGIMYLHFVADGKYDVYCTTRLLYPYGSATSSYEKNGEKKTSTADDFCLAIELNADGTKANLTLYNVSLETDIAKVIYVDYASIPVTVTADGYVLEAAALEAAIDNVPKKDYDMTDFKATINTQGRRINGSFTIDGHDVTFSAKMLNESYILF